MSLLRPSLKHVRSFSTVKQQTLTEPHKNYDVVIVGGGHNGLVAAGYLARAGKKVCVLERRHVVGGAAVTEEIVPGFKFSRASYVLSLLRPQIYKDLELKKHGLKVYLRNPSSYTPLRQCYWKDGGPRSLTLGPDETENKRQIGQFSQKDAEAYVKYEEQLGRVVAAIDPLIDLSPADVMELLAAPTTWRKIKTVWNKPQLRQAAKSLSSLGSEIVNLYEFMTAPGARILEQYFESEPLKATLATDAVIGANITPYTPGSGYVLLHHVMGELDGIRGAWGYPEGGMGAVTQAMALSASSHSAHIFTNTAVSKILVNERDQVTGVVTERGKEITARLVLSNATPQRTLQLMPGTRSQTENLGGVDYTSPVTKINVAVNKLPNFLATPNDSEGCVMPHHRTTIHLNCENIAMISEAHEAASRGEMSSRPVIELVIPSSLDPTLGPSGSHVCLLFTQYAPKGCAWTQQDKEKYANIVFNSIEDYAPGFRNSIVGHEILSPLDLEKIFGLSGGNIFHGSMCVDRLFLCRPSPRGPASPFTSVTGLHLCGAGAHPGGGVMGAPGRIAAQAALKQLSS